MTTISLVTTTLGDRGWFLDRLLRQAHFMRAFEWVVCGPAELSWIKNRHPNVKHVVANEVIGTARNLCAEAATGDILVQLDDDDWQHPTMRISKQFAALTTPMPGTNHPPLVVGSSWLYYLEANTGKANRLSYWDNRYCLPGATLAYYKHAWKAHPFPDSKGEDGPFTSFFEGSDPRHRKAAKVFSEVQGEDNAFTGHWGNEGRLLDMHDPKLIVYMREHGKHLPEQRDWWKETQHRGRRKSAHEIMQERLKNPRKPLDFVLSDTERDLAVAHEEEAATVYVKWLMGSDYEWFCKPLTTKSESAGQGALPTS